MIRHALSAKILTSTHVELDAFPLHIPKQEPKELSSLEEIKRY